jgi:demethylspheroidene O-methyltransferase
MSEFIDNLTWRSRWVLRRNAILGSPVFQRWASRTPLVRLIARRRAAAQFDMIAGFVYTQVLTAFVEAELIPYLQGGLRSVKAIMHFAGLDEDAVVRLLKAGQSLKICESPQPGMWTLGEAGAPLSANEGAIAMIRHHHLLYSDLTKPLSLLRQGRRTETALSAYWTYASKDDSDAGAAGYSALMAATQPMVSQQILDAYDFAQHRRMLDIGGGSGAFSTAVAGIAGELKIGIFDLPEVIAVAEKRLGRDSVSTDFTLHPGSFKDTPIPQGYDLITLVRILHDHDDTECKALLSKVYAALPESGRLLVVEPMADTPSAQPMGEAYFGMYLWAMGSGRPRSVEETSAMLRNAGFTTIRAVKTALPIITSALVATK